LVTLPPEKKAVGCKWVYTIKLNSKWVSGLLKERLIAQEY